MAAPPRPTDSFPDALHIRTPGGASATVSPHGAQVLSWNLPAEGEQLYMSSCANYKIGTPIRGGIPIIFPQFAGEGSLPKHGFARLVQWALRTHESDRIVFRLTEQEASHALWRHRHRCDLDIRLIKNSLQLEIEVTNTDAIPFAFTAAFHTYLRVADIKAVRIAGLRGLHFRDTANNNTECVDRDALRAIDGELDRIYFGALRPVQIMEAGNCLRAASENFPDIVIWNPGQKKAAELRDLDRDGWRHFVCAEAAVIRNPVVLAPGERWKARHVLTRLRSE